MAAKPWTEAEKLNIFFQVMEKAGTIDYDSLKLPEGRTKKAVQVMIDREKTKAKKARAAKEGCEEDGGVKASAPKRKANSEAGDAAGKKPKTPRKKSVKASEDKGDVEDEEAAGVKAEPEDEELV